MVALGMPAWIGDLASHFFGQYALAAAILLVVVAWRRHKALSLVAVGCLVVSVWFASTPRRATGDAASGGTVNTRFRLFYTNVRSRNNSPSAVMDVIRRENPDVIVLIEASERFKDAINALAVEYPQVAIDLREHNDGLAILTRLNAPRIAVEKTGASGFRAALASITMADGANIVVCGVHTHPPSSLEGWRRRDEELMEIERHVRGLQQAVILVGDLNTTMWAQSFKRFLAATQLRDARMGRGVLPTWPAVAPRVLRLPIDHFLHSDEIRVLDMRLGDSIGSDHLPLIIDFTNR